jgi:hypothetical protein
MWFKDVLVSVLLVLGIAAQADAQLFAPGGTVYPSPVPRAYLTEPVAQCVIARPCPFGDQCVILTACPTGTLVPPQAAPLPAEPRTPTAGTLPADPPVVVEIPSCPTCPACPACPLPPAAATKPVVPRPAPPRASTLPAQPRVAVRPALPPPAPLVVNLNTASTLDLEKLPMIDNATAKAMEAGRPYTVAHELVTKHVVSPEVFRIIEPYVVVR